MEHKPGSAMPIPESSTSAELGVQTPPVVEVPDFAPTDTGSINQTDTPPGNQAPPPPFDDGGSEPP